MRLVTPIRRNGFWVLRRRVPKRYAGFDARKIVRISTGIRVADDPKAITATPLSQQLNRTLEAEWLALTNGEKPRARQRYDDAVLDAKALGFTYLTTPELALRPLEEILRRIEKLIARRTGDMTEEVTALLGGEDRPVVRTSELKTEYEALQQAALAQMSPDQRRKWHNQRKRAVENFRKAIVDDKRLSDLTKADGLKFRKWWQDRVVNDGVQIRTANKSIGTVSRMLKRVSDAKELGVPAILAGLRIEGGVARQRPPFEVSFIEARILALDAFDDLNEEARRVVYIMVETGLRPSEIVNLTAKRIVLNHKVPHVVIEPEGRVLKSETSERKFRWSVSRSPP
jgi:integrase